MLYTGGFRQVSGVSGNPFWVRLISQKTTHSQLLYFYHLCVIESMFCSFIHISASKNNYRNSLLVLWPIVSYWSSMKTPSKNLKSAPDTLVLLHIVLVQLLVSYYRMPILYNNITGGRFLCVVFFLCVALAGLSSVVSLMERPIHVLSDFGSK